MAITATRESVAIEPLVPVTRPPVVLGISLRWRLPADPSGELEAVRVGHRLPSTQEVACSAAH